MAKSKMYPPKINVYFGKSDKQLLEKFIRIAKKFNISESRLAVLTLRKALKEVADDLDTQEMKIKLLDET